MLVAMLLTWGSLFGSENLDREVDLSLEANESWQVDEDCEDDQACTLGGSTELNEAKKMRECECDQNRVRWTRRLGDYGFNFVSGVATDRDSNAYFIGFTSAALDENELAGRVDGYVAKFDVSGHKQWTRQFGTYDMDYARAVTVDELGNVYVTGSTNAGSSYTGLDGNISAGGDDLFVIKYDADGEKQWTRQLGTEGDDAGQGIAVDRFCNVYVTGSTRAIHETMGLDGNSAFGAQDAFVVKYSADGEKQWTHQLGTVGDDIGKSIAIDSCGYIYLTGSTTGQFAGTLKAGKKDIFLARYTPYGSHDWTRQVGTPENDYGNGVVVDDDAHIYVAGSTNAALDGTGHFGSSDAFIAKFSTWEGEERWIRQFGSTTWDDASGIAVDAFSQLYVSGTTFGSIEGNVSSGLRDAFVSKFGDDGTMLWSQQYGGPDTDSGRGIAVVENAEHVYLVGSTIVSRDSPVQPGKHDVFLTQICSR